MEEGGTGADSAVGVTTWSVCLAVSIARSLTQGSGQWERFASLTTGLDPPTLALAQGLTRPWAWPQLTPQPHPLLSGPHAHSSYGGIIFGRRPAQKPPLLPSDRSDWWYAATGG
mmetsp:Transcript_52628/g.93923  ORF Transcript_52628/g.93923 Transcript_52628/m.93923 type:complete len:114 (-) Transcript_52628:209-550(-)